MTATQSSASQRSATVDSRIEYLRVERVARLLDVSKKRVYQLVQERRLEAIRLGPRQMRIPRASLEAYLAARQEEAIRELDF